MAILRGREVFAQVVIGAGENSLNRRIHSIEWHRSKDEMLLLEGDTLPPFVCVGPVVADSRGIPHNPCESATTGPTHMS